MFNENLVHAIVDRSPIARLAQLDTERRVQALPFVFARVGRELWSPIDGKPKRSARLDRLRWLEAEPRVCILIDHYAEDWSRLWWLKLFCHADIHRGAHPHWKQAVAALGSKYPQYDDVEMFLGEPTLIRFEYQRWKSWAAGGEDALMEQFGVE